MNKNTIIFITMSLVFGVGAVLIAKNWLNDSQKELTEAQVNIVMAAVSIPTGTILTAKHLSLKVFPKSMAPDKAVQSLAEAIGKVAKNQFYLGDIVRQERLAKQGDGSYLASLIGENMRAITIRVNDVVGVAGFLLPGNRVDILNTYQQDGKPTTEVILSNINILAVDQRASSGENKPQLVRAITVEVDLTQAEILMSARRSGYLQLALRNPIDDEPVVIASEKPAAEPKVDVVADITPKPAPKIRQRQRVELIRGVRQQTVQVDI
ncbi:Flp pilus assembly protein CpaB [Colwellia sp. MT41]|uniref:Flp pilus assembly protein CpaB n=1 Tax=Colwellia marinimaniae TaxID=1513592 RepID=A0ABQ0MRA0_9GAMM|nr:MULTISPECIES: Flp pilus assembly protein CpaB [Colwellia]ALO34039.1 Flp pilus assembly protein CpaB [Colwellia sp. MT41]GAW94868.1 Flp pilus assembly protein CpaB [Colwellia marinimaniae]